jgi:hypothetical protein
LNRRAEGEQQVVKAARHGTEAETKTGATEASERRMTTLVMVLHDVRAYLCWTKTLE